MPDFITATPNATYTGTIDALESSDSAVPEIWNTVNQVLLNNTAALNQRLSNVESQGSVPDNSVTDAKIGVRTPNPASFPTEANTNGTLTQWLSWILNRLGQITGRSWWQNPKMSLEQALDKRGDTMGGTLRLTTGLGQHGIVVNSDDNTSDIVGTSNAGSTIIGGGITANTVNGAWIRLEGKDRGGPDLGGGIYFGTAANGTVSINGATVYHAGNHIHRTDAQNDARFALVGTTAGRTDAQNDSRYLRKDTAGILTGSLTVNGNLVASAIDSGFWVLDGTRFQVKTYNYTPSGTIIVPAWQDDAPSSDSRMGGWVLGVNTFVLSFPNLTNGTRVDVYTTMVIPPYINWWAAVDAASDQIIIVFHNQKRTSWTANLNNTYWDITAWTVVG